VRWSIANAAVIAAALMAAAAAADAAEVKLPYRGLTLNGNLVMPEGKSVADGVVLITHGTLAHNGMEIVHTLQELLQERGLGSLAITLSLGVDGRRGMYDCTIPHRHRHTDAVDEIAAWVEWLKGQGAKGIALLGHSRGGNQTAWFAAEHPDPAVSAMVLVAPALADPSSLQASYKKAFGKEPGPVLDRAREMVAGGQGKALIQPADILYCPDSAASAEALLSYHAFDPRLNTPKLVEGVKVPTLVIAASADEQVPGVDQAFEPLAARGQAQVVVIDGADHFFRDLYAEEAADAIEKFLRR